MSAENSIGVLAVHHTEESEMAALRNITENDAVMSLQNLQPLPTLANEEH